MEDLGFLTSTSALSTAAEVAPLYVRDELDALAEGVTLPLKTTTASAAAGEDDEFDEFYGPASSPAPPPPPPPPSAVAGAPLADAAPLLALPPPPQPPTALAVSEASAAAALAAVRASLSAASAEEAARERQAVEARIKATSLLANPEVGLSAVGEVEEEEEEEEEEREEKTEAEKSTTAAAAAEPKEGGMLLQAAPGSEAGEDLEAQFQAATAAALAGGSTGASSSSSSSSLSPPPFAPVSLRLAHAALLDSATLAPFYAGIQPEAVDSSLGCLGRLLAVRLPLPLQRSRDAVFACARRPYDGAAPQQSELMATLYHAITGASPGAPGASWTDIGFQREADFSTDLRGVGMLGPLQVLAMYERHPLAGRALQQQASQPLHPFPLMIQCLSLTAKTLHALRLGKLNRLLCQRASAQAQAQAQAQASSGGEEGEQAGAGGLAMALAHDWFAGLALDFAEAWRADPNASIMRLGHIVKAVVDRAYSSPAGVLDRLAAAEKK